MPKAGDSSSGSGGGGSGGWPRSGDVKDLPLFFFRIGAVVTLSVAGLFISRRQRPPRQPQLPPAPSGTTMGQTQRKAKKKKKELEDSHQLPITIYAVKHEI